MQRGYDILTVQETYGCGVVITKRIGPVPWGGRKRSLHIQFHCALSPSGFLNQDISGPRIIRSRGWGLSIVPTPLAGGGGRSRAPTRAFEREKIQIACKKIELIESTQLIS